MNALIRFFIVIYQKTLSPDHGIAAYFFPHGWCRFYPSCSEYMKDAVYRYGTTRGIAKGAGRLLRCHPWHAGGIDEVA